MFLIFYNLINLLSDFFYVNIYVYLYKKFTIYIRQLNYLIQSTFTRLSIMQFDSSIITHRAVSTSSYTIPA